MKRAAIALALLALIPVAGHTELLGRTVTAVATSQTFTINASRLTVVNDGDNEIYVRIFVDGETPAAAVAGTHPEIKGSGESFAFGQVGNIQAISIVCAASETTTVRLFYW